MDRLTREAYIARSAEIEQQRATLTTAPAPLFTQQQSVLKTLVDHWAEMTTDEKKRMLAAIFDSVTATADGITRLEPCEDWRPYLVAAIPKPVQVRRGQQSGRRDSNPRPRPWQGRALPLRHFRKCPRSADMSIIRRLGYPRSIARFRLDPRFAGGVGCRAVACFRSLELTYARMSPARFARFTRPSEINRYRVARDSPKRRVASATTIQSLIVSGNLDASCFVAHSLTDYHTYLDAGGGAMKDTTGMGDITEWQVAAALLRRGMKLLRPLSSSSRYDFLIEHDNGRFTRVQCKTGRLKKGCVMVRMYSVSGHNTVPKRYGGQVDAFGVFCPDTNTTYLVPMDALNGCGNVAALRVSPARNGQRKRIRDAADFVIS